MSHFDSQEIAVAHQKWQQSSLEVKTNKEGLVQATARGPRKYLKHWKEKWHVKNNRKNSVFFTTIGDANGAPSSTIREDFYLVRQYFIFTYSK